MTVFERLLSYRVIHDMEARHGKASTLNHITVLECIASRTSEKEEAFLRNGH